MSSGKTASGVWLKGNTHTHTTNSDSKLSPEVVQEKYAAQDYDFIFLTDHWKLTPPPAAEKASRLLVIPATEIDFHVGRNYFHIVCLGLKRQWERRKFRSLNAALDFVAAEGALAIAAHPYWSGIPGGAYLTARSLLGLEVYNTVCDLDIARGYSAVHWDELLSAGKKLYGFAADDSHGRPFGDVGKGWIMVRAREKSEAAILAALRAGDFYATQGPQIHDVTLQGRTASVTCSPAARINFIANSYYGSVTTDPAGQLTQATWTAPAAATYLRVECVDAQGRTAWSNPVFFA